MEELGIPKLTTKQIEVLCQIAETAAKKYVLSQVSLKLIDRLNIIVEAKGDKPITVEVDIDFATDFSDPLNINNPYWQLLPGNTFVYQAVEDDECIVNEIIVTELTKSDFAAPYDQIIARVVSDMEWADTDCDGNRLC